MRNKRRYLLCYIDNKPYFTFDKNLIFMRNKFIQWNKLWFVNLILGTLLFIFVLSASINEITNNRQITWWGWLALSLAICCIIGMTIFYSLRDYKLNTYKRYLDIFISSKEYKNQNKNYIKKENEFKIYKLKQLKYNKTV